MTKSVHILFVCSRNQWRSPTAEKVWSQESGLQCQSVGTSPRAKRTVTGADIRWADVILVMETKHKSRLQAQFSNLLRFKPTYVLDIPDAYGFMDAELVRMLEQEKERFMLESGLRA